MMENNRDKSNWAVGGCLLMGIGVGFFFLPTSLLAFMVSITIGLGLVNTPVISKLKYGGTHV